MTDPLEPSDYLKIGLSKIDTPEKWTSGENARDARGSPVRTDNPRAVCFCTNGALMAIDPKGGSGPRNWAKAVIYMREAMGENLSGFNDTHTWEQVIERWNAAIGQALADEAATNAA